MFFMQSQLGLVVAIIAFHPLIVFVLTSKKMDANQKGILGGIGGSVFDYRRCYRFRFQSALCGGII